MKTNVILADDQSLFCAGMEHILAHEDNIQVIAKCDNQVRLHQLLNYFRHSILLCSSAFDWQTLIPHIQTTGCRSIVLLESGESPRSWLELGVNGIFYRQSSSLALIDCVQKVLKNDRYLQMPADSLASLYRQAISSQIFSMLSRKERLIVAYVLQNWKNSDIAAKMQTTEQTVKNYLRSIYRKTGTFDRLSLALFAAQNQLFPSNLLSDTA